MNYIVLLLLIIVVPQVMRFIYLRASALRRWRRSSPSPLTPAVLAELAWWQTWNIVLFIAFLLFFIAAIAVSWFKLLPVTWIQIIIAVYIAFGLGGLLHHYSIRCPHCGMNIGVQSNLLLPQCCERCQVEFYG
jgi:hypothetical protein